MKRSLSLFAAPLALWGLLVALSASSVYWRDAGEFLVSAFFLDVAHPPGSPLYSQLANFFALLPLGPVAWRINTFSAFSALVSIVLAVLITWELLPPRLARPGRLLLSCVPAAVLAAAEAFTTQAFTSEVYFLNSCFLELLLLLYLRYLRQRDQRLLLIAAFVSGLALGSHVSAVLPIAAIAVVVLSDWRAVKHLVLPGFIAGLAGLAVYGYVPVRAAAHPPLNSGAASSLRRFVALVTNERDRVLRHAPEASMPQEEPSGAMAGRIKQDLKRISQSVAAPVLILALGGLCFLLWAEGRFAVALASTALANWLFFFNWDPDPWQPLFAVLGILAAYGAAVFIAGFGHHRRFAALVAAAVVLLLALVPAHSRNWLHHRDHAQPAQLARSVLKPLPAGAVFITEPDWFLVQYLQRVEGYREDLLLVYQPEIFFPEYFKPLEITDQAGQVFSNGGAGSPPDERSRLVELLNFAGPRTVLAFAPTPLLSHWLAPAAAFRPGGAVVVGPAGEAAAQFVSAKALQFVPLRETIVAADSPDVPDARHYMETSVTNAADLLARKDQTDAAIELLERVCLPLSARLCSEVALNNLALYYGKNGDWRAAVSLLERGLSAWPAHHTTLKQNLKNAVQELEKEEREPQA